MIVSHILLVIVLKCDGRCRAFCWAHELQELRWCHLETILSSIAFCHMSPSTRLSGNESQECEEGTGADTRAPCHCCLIGVSRSEPPFNPRFCEPPARRPNATTNRSVATAKCGGFTLAAGGQGDSQWQSVVQGRSAGWHSRVALSKLLLTRRTTSIAPSLSLSLLFLSKLCVPYYPRGLETSQRPLPFPVTDPKCVCKPGRRSMHNCLARALHISVL